MCTHSSFGNIRIERFTDLDGNKHEARWCGGCGDTLFDDIVKAA